jgi:hypothetical protein
MPTLSKAKTETKLIFKWLGLSLGLIIFVFIAIKAVGFIIGLNTPPPPPEAAFGKLPAIPFPTQNEASLTYSLDTVTGFLPDFPDRTKVYKILPNPPTLLGLDNTRKKVKAIGFSSSGTPVSGNMYKWTDQDRNITMDIYSSDFIFSTSYLSKSFRAYSSVSETNDAIGSVKSFLSSMSLLPSDIDDEKTKATLYSITGGSLSPATKIPETKIVKVDFFQQDLDDLPIYYVRGILSSIEFSVSKNVTGLEVVDGHFFHKNISKTSTTYALKTAKEAYTDLQEGKAYVAYKPDNSTQFTIKKVSLGYYAGEATQQYLMPIIVFEGNDNFTAYVSAIKDEWIGN